MAHSTQNDEVAASSKSKNCRRHDAAEKVASFQLARLSEQRAKYATALSEVSMQQDLRLNLLVLQHLLRGLEPGQSDRKSADVSKTPSSPATELPVRNLENELDAPEEYDGCGEFRFRSRRFQATSPKVSPSGAAREGCY